MTWLRSGFSQEWRNNKLHINEDNSTGSDPSFCYPSKISPSLHTMFHKTYPASREARSKSVEFRDMYILAVPYTPSEAHACRTEVKRVGMQSARRITINGYESDGKTQPKTCCTVAGYDRVVTQSRSEDGASGCKYPFPDVSIPLFARECESCNIAPIRRMWSSLSRAAQLSK